MGCDQNIIGDNFGYEHPQKTNVKILGRIFRYSLVSVAAIGLVFGTTSAATASSPVDADSQAKTALTNLGLYTAPIDGVEKSPRDGANVARVDSTKGLVVPSGSASGDMTLKPAGVGEASRISSGISTYKVDNSYSYVLTDASSGTNAGYSIINSESAPTNYRYQIDVGSKPAILELTTEEAVLVKDSSGVVVNVLAPAWAKDALGIDLKSSYTVDGNIVTQTVNHKGATYPVVADPRAACDWLYCTAEFNKTETDIVATNGWGWTGILAGACTVIAGPVGGTACGIGGAIWATTANIAKATNQCMGLRMGNVTGPLAGITAFPVVYNGNNCY